MALTIRMRIDDHDEHSYYYATGDGTEIELIPLVVDENGEFIPDEGKAYNRVTVNVPTTELETLIATTNQTYNAPSGTAYNVVEVNVQPILEAVSRSYSSNGTYTVQPSEGYDGISTATIVVDVPNTYTAGDEGKVVQNGELVAQSSQEITENGVYDTTLKNEVVVNVNSGDALIRHGKFTTVAAPIQNGTAQSVSLDPVVPSGYHISYLMVKQTGATLPNAGNCVIQSELTKQDMTTNPDYSSTGLSNRLYEVTLYTSSATATSYATPFTTTRKYGEVYITGYSFNYGDVIGIRSRTSFVVAVTKAGGRGLQGETEYEYVAIITPDVV